jgi:hypothetical protein
MDVSSPQYTRASPTVCSQYKPRSPSSCCLQCPVTLHLGPNAFSLWRYVIYRPRRSSDTDLHSDVVAVSVLLACYAASLGNVIRSRSLDTAY